MARTKHIDGEVDKIKKVDRDELAELIVRGLNKSEADGVKVAHFLDEQEDPSMVTDWVSTGSSLLDLAISNRKNGGLPAGRIVVLEGLEASGKSLVCAHIIANTQKMGGIGALIDTENAAAPEFWKAVGIDISSMPYASIFTVEKIFAKIEEIIGLVRKGNGNRLVTIVVDSIAQASCETEMESEHGKDGYNTHKAIVVNKALRKITGLIGQQRVLLVFTNQMRANMNRMGFGPMYVSSGGKALAFAASVRVKLAKIKALKRGNDVIGNVVKAVVEKNRMGPPHRNATMEILFDSGIQDLKSWLEFLKDHGIAKKSTGESNYSLQLPSGVVKLSSKEFAEKINTDKAFKDEVYDLISNEYIMKYRDTNETISEDVVSDESDGDNEELSDD